MSSNNDTDELAQNISDAIIPIIEQYLAEREQPPAESGVSEEKVRAIVAGMLDDYDFGGISEERVREIAEEYGGDGVGVSEERAIEIAQEHGGDGVGISEERAREIAQEYGGSGGGISEERAIEIAQEYGGLDPETRARLDAALDRTEGALGELEDRLSRRVGPETPTGDFHTHAGWGLHLSTDRPYHFGETTVEALTDGLVNFELIEYDGNTGELVDETEVRIPRGEEAVTIDLDIDAPEGEFLLTRDWVNPPAEDDRVSLRRQLDYSGWGADSGDGLTLHGSGHDEYSDNLHWYYTFSLGVRPTDVTSQ